MRWLKQQTFISHSSGGRKWDQRAGLVSFWWGPSSWIYPQLAFHGISLSLSEKFHLRERERESEREIGVSSSFYKGHWCHHDVPILMTLPNLNYLPTSKYHHLADGVSTYKFLRETHIQSIVVGSLGNHWCGVISKVLPALSTSSTMGPLLQTEILALESFCWKTFPTW